MDISKQVITSGSHDIPNHLKSLSDIMAEMHGSHHNILSLSGCQAGQFIQLLI